MLTMAEKISVKLSAPSIFPDLNQADKKPKNHKRNEIKLSRLKFKHFKQMHELPPENQIFYAISTLTGLSNNDIDELYTEDLGQITKLIIGFMKDFVEVAQEMTGNK